jgi:hypothetical protein
MTRAAALMPVSQALFGQARWRRPPDLRHAQGLRHVPLDLAEAEAAAAHLPILFHATADRPVALLRSTQAGPDVVLDTHGRWRLGYVPACLRLYPFAVMPQAGAVHTAAMGAPAVLAFDTASRLITDDPQDPAFFQPDGSPAPALAAVMAAARAMAGAAMASRAALAALRAADLLIPLPPQAGLSPSDTDGYQVVDPQRLAALDATAAAALYPSGALQLAWLHRASLGVINRLVALSDLLSQPGAAGIEGAVAMPGPDLPQFLAALAAAHLADEGR